MIAPLTTALEDAGVEILRSRKVASVTCSGGRISEIGVEDGAFDMRSRRWKTAGRAAAEPVEELVLAVPPEGLSELVRSGPPGASIVDAEPALAAVSRLRSQRIPIVHLYFKRRLPGIPPEPVGLYRSPLALAFTDISQRWAGTTDLGGGTVLSVSASNPDALPGTRPHDDGFAIVRELAEYLDFRPGTRWGESEDVNWDWTLYEPNTDTQLSLNETGADPWRPVPGCPDVVNLSIAGDFCRNDVGMMTIESAVTTGLAAAASIVQRRGVGDQRGLEALGGGGEEDIRDGILTLPAALAIRDPGIRSLFCADDDDPERLAMLGAAFRRQLDDAEAVLDGIADSARAEARRFAHDPEPLLALVDEVRQLSRR